MRRIAGLLSLILVSGLTAAAQTTTFTYTYDNYGQLTRSERSTGASNRVHYNYDAAGNRTQVKKGVAAPVANDDFAYLLVCPNYEETLIYPLENDEDADLPNDTLLITGLSGTDSQWAQIAGGGTHIFFYENGVNGSGGWFSFDYQLQDDAGQTDSGHIDLYVEIGWECPEGWSCEPPAPCP